MSERIKSTHDEIQFNAGRLDSIRVCMKYFLQNLSMTHCSFR